MEDDIAGTTMAGTGRDGIGAATRGAMDSVGAAVGVGTAGMLAGTRLVTAGVSITERIPVDCGTTAMPMPLGITWGDMAAVIMAAVIMAAMEVTVMEGINRGVRFATDFAAVPYRTGIRQTGSPTVRVFRLK
jgi:hypothetical protein